MKQRIFAEIRLMTKNEGDAEAVVQSLEHNYDQNVNMKTPAAGKLGDWLVYGTLIVELPEGRFDDDERITITEAGVAALDACLGDGDNVPTEADWQAAKRHFDFVRSHYVDQLGVPGVNTSLALAVVFGPLAARYDGGERTRDLYNEMTEVK